MSDACNRENGFAVSVKAVAGKLPYIETIVLNISGLSMVAENIDDVKNVSANMPDINGALSAAQRAEVAKDGALEAQVVTESARDTVLSEASEVDQKYNYLKALSVISLGLIVQSNGHLVVDIADQSNIENMSIDVNGHLIVNYSEGA